MFFKAKLLHFVGIGGIGMSGIAEILLNLGYQVTGSDLKLSPVTEHLAALGAHIYEGHAADNVDSADAIVVSSAVRKDNPEVVEARRRKIPVIPRGEMLAELMRLKYGIAIAGSHGKTTTTSLTAAVLSHARLDPTVVVGGRVAGMGSNAHLGDSDFLVVESDESDRSFLQLAPILAIVTNIDREHLDCYSSLQDVQDAFVEFVNKVPFYGAAILCLDEEPVRAILPRIRRPVLTYGMSEASGAPAGLKEPAGARVPDLAASNVRTGFFCSDFRLAFRGRDLGDFHLQLAGRHNVGNAMAAALVALELDVAVDDIREGLAQFRGVDRRMQVRGKEAGVMVIDDYGHHPTEIRATLAALRECRFRRIHVLFQPHRYSRTHHLLHEFLAAFSGADALYLLDIYAASEKPIEGVHSSILARRLRESGHPDTRYFASMDEAVAAIVPAVREGDAVITLGAGSVWQAGDKILAALAKAASDRQTAPAVALHQL